MWYSKSIQNHKLINKPMNCVHCWDWDQTIHMLTENCLKKVPDQQLDPVDAAQFGVVS